MNPWVERSAIALGGFLLGAGLVYFNPADPTGSPLEPSSHMPGSRGGMVSASERTPAKADATRRKADEGPAPVPMTVTRPGRNYPLLHGLGFSFAARWELGLSDDQCHEVNRIVGVAKAALGAEMLGRMKRDPVFDRPDKKGKSYSIEAFPEVSARIIQQATADLEKAVGSLGSEIMGEIGQGSTFLGAGENDILLTVNPEVVKGSFDEAGNPRVYWVVSYSLLDPKTGGRKAGGVIDFSKFNEEFMDLFDEPEGNPEFDDPGEVR